MCDKDYYKPEDDGMAIQRDGDYLFCQRPLAVNPAHVIKVEPSTIIDGKPTTEIHIIGISVHRLADSYHSVVKKLNGDNGF